MNLRKEFVDKVLECQWLQRCGKRDSFEFEVEYLDRKEDVEKNINSVKWENFCLDRRGDFTSYLSRNYQNEYNMHWNKEIRIIKREYIPIISDSINRTLPDYGLAANVFEDMRMNIVTLFMLEYYSQYYSSDIYEKMFKLYMAGHLPCGWQGDYPGGKFLIY